MTIGRQIRLRRVGGTAGNRGKGREPCERRGCPPDPGWLWSAGHPRQPEAPAGRERQASSYFSAHTAAFCELNPAGAAKRHGREEQ